MLGGASCLYPVALKLEGRRVLVVGGGAAAAQKVRGLLKARAEVTVVAPRLNRTLGRLSAQGKVRWKRKSFSPGDLQGVELVIAATGEGASQRRIHAEARRRRLWVNVADAPELCDFYAVAFEQRGPLLVSVSTQGAAPALAKFLRRRWLSDITAAGAYLKWLAPARARLKRRLAGQAARTRRLVDERVFDLLREGKSAEAKRRFQELAEHGTAAAQKRRRNAPRRGRRAPPKPTGSPRMMPGAKEEGALTPILLDAPHPVTLETVGRQMKEAGVEPGRFTPLAELLATTGLRDDFLRTLARIKTVLWEGASHPGAAEEARRLDAAWQPEAGIPFYGYDGFAYARWVREHLGAVLVLTGRYVLTYDEEDRRLHGRTFVVFGDAVVVSTWGALEAPAKEKLFYVKYQALAAAGSDLALAYRQANEAVGGLSPQQERFSRVVAFLTMQALLFALRLPDPCHDPDCLFFVARTQRDLLRQAEASPRPCPRHQRP